MAQRKPKNEVSVAEQRALIEELRAQRKARRETNRRVDELKLNLLRITEHHMDHVVRLIRRWLPI